MPHPVPTWCFEKSHEKQGLNLTVKHIVFSNGVDSSIIAQAIIKHTLLYHPKAGTVHLGVYVHLLTLLIAFYALMLSTFKQQHNSDIKDEVTQKQWKVKTVFPSNATDVVISKANSAMPKLCLGAITLVFYWSFS